MNKIKSFLVDHRKIKPGIYVSRIDGDITTFDMRCKRPNMGEYLSNLQMHSFEHMFATYIRNSEIANAIIYFGPMGCQTGFYLLTRDLQNKKLLFVIVEVLNKILNHDGDIFGSSVTECGNYKNLHTDAAKEVALEYLKVLQNSSNDFLYSDKSE